MFRPALIFLALVCLACTPEPQTPTEALGFADTSITFRLDGCTGTIEACGGVNISMPIFRGGDSGVARMLNDSLEQFCATVLGGPDSSYSTAASSLLRDYLESKQTFPEMAMPWLVEIESSVMCLDSFVCIQIDEYSFLGGAHPNSATSFITFDLRSKRFVRIDSLIIDKDDFINQAEEAFRVARELKRTDGFSESGFWFPDGYVLPENIGVTKDSVILHYNTYEVGPYVMGPTALALVRPKLR